MSSSPGHNRFNIVSIWPPGPSWPVPVGHGGIVGLSERSGYLDYQKQKQKNKKNLMLGPSLSIDDTINDGHSLY